MCLPSIQDLGFGPLPIYIALIFFTQTFIIYCIAVLRGDVDPIFPYLSSAADRRPESCIFSIGTNISAFMVLILVWIRYRQMRGVFYSYRDLRLVKQNDFARWFAYLSAVSMFVVANVQETAITQVHMTAAVAAFGGFLVWMIFQCHFTLKGTPDITKPMVFYYRATWTVLSFICFFVSIGFGTSASIIFHQTYPDLPTPRPWSRHFYQPGYELHQISAFAEWGCAISQVLFMLSFMPEFEEIHVSYLVVCKYIDGDVLEEHYYDEDNYRVPR